MVEAVGEAVTRFQPGDRIAYCMGLFDYTAAAEELDASAGKVFEAIASGKVKVDIGRTWPLAEARAAHEALEPR